MDWFLYDNGLRHERVNGFQLQKIYVAEQTLNTFKHFSKLLSDKS